MYSFPFEYLSFYHHSSKCFILLSFYYSTLWGINLVWQFLPKKTKWLLRWFQRFQKCSKNLFLEITRWGNRAHFCVYRHLSLSLCIWLPSCSKYLILIRGIESSNGRPILFRRSKFPQNCNVLWINKVLWFFKKNKIVQLYKMIRVVK